MACEVPVWQKVNLTLEEAAAYFNIGINKLRQMTDNRECEKYVLWVGNRRLIKRIPFELYLRNEYSIWMEKVALMWYDTIIIHVRALFQKGVCIVAGKRKDKNGRILKTGENQRKNGTYVDYSREDFRKVLASRLYLYFSLLFHRYKPQFPEGGMY